MGVFARLEYSPEGDHWSANEADPSAFKDARLGRRFAELLRQLSDGLGNSIPFACQDWAATKAAYRFLANDRVDEADILAGHFAATATRFEASQGPVLLLQDTTEFIFQRAAPEKIGFTKSVNSGRDRRGRLRHHTLCGILMHTSLACTTAGLPLGLTALKVWTRQSFKGTTALKRKINPTRVPIEQKESMRWLDNLRRSIKLVGEPKRCVHIGDRESDIYELYCLCQELGAHFLVRTCVDRLACDGSRTIAKEMAEAKPLGQHKIVLYNGDGESRKVVLDIKARRMTVLPPIGKFKRYPSLELTVLHAIERPPSNTGKKVRDPIEWKLLTDLRVTSKAEAIEKLEWYAMRWKIETFHKVLKSGCKAEAARLRTAERLANLIAVYCILSWRILWLAMVHRTSPNAKPQSALTADEIAMLDLLVKNTGNRNTASGSLAFYIVKLARLGGYLARSRDPPPGIIVIWRGLSRLADIQLGAEAKSNALMGN
jgi:Transposase DNA-binding